MARSTASFSVPTGAPNEIWLILLGKIGTGKSSFGKQIFAIDTPGFLDTTVTETTMQTEVAKPYQMTATPGPHAFLLAIEPNRFTPEEAEAVKYLDKIFGSKAVHHTIIVFTHGDSFRKTTVEQYLAKLTADAPLRQLLDQCQNRYITVNNNGTEAEKESSVKKLLEMVSVLIENTNGQVFQPSDFDAVANELAAEQAKGCYQPFKSDGTFILLPRTQKIIIDGRLRRTLGRRAV